jgi:HAMP domain-containing protein
VSGTVRLHRVIAAPPERVYRVFIDPRALLRWLPPYGFVGESRSPSVASQRQYPRSIDRAGRDDAAAVALGAVALALVWRWSGRATSSMKHITRVAEEIQAGSLDRRIGLKDQAAETQALADSFDAMLDRLEQSNGRLHADRLSVIVDTWSRSSGRTTSMSGSRN